MKLGYLCVSGSLGWDYYEELESGKKKVEK